MRRLGKHSIYYIIIPKKLTVRLSSWLFEQSYVSYLMQENFNGLLKHWAEYAKASTSNIISNKANSSCNNWSLYDLYFIGHPKAKFYRGSYIFFIVNAVRDSHHGNANIIKINCPVHRHADIMKYFQVTWFKCWISIEPTIINGITEFN